MMLRMSMVEETRSRAVEMPEKLQFRVENPLPGEFINLGEESNGWADEMAGKIQFRFEKLTVWQSARRLGAEVYTATQSFPMDELFGLTSQLRRAAVSIAANIAEGSGRNSDRDFAHFLEIAYGSAMELAALLHVAADTHRLDGSARDRLLSLTSEVTAQLSALNRSLDVERTKTPFSRKPQPAALASRLLDSSSLDLLKHGR